MINSYTKEAMYNSARILLKELCCKVNQKEEKQR